MDLISPSNGQDLIFHLIEITSPSPFLDLRLQISATSPSFPCNPIHLDSLCTCPIAQKDRIFVGGLGCSAVMADGSSSVVESAVDKIKEKKLRHDGDGDGSSSSSSSSDSDSEISSKVKSKIKRLFGRQRPVHTVLGSGKPADVILWRNKKISGGVLAGATAIWVLFELLEYNLLTLVCHILILSLAIIFLWANATIFINKSPPRLPELVIPEDVVVNTALAIRFEINRAFKVLRDIASGRDLKKFLGVIAGLWVLSLVGGSCNFLTLFYIVFVVLHTVPVLYEKYEDQVDTYGEKAHAELKKQYAVFDARVLSKIPRGPLKKNKKV